MLSNQTKLERINSKLEQYGLKVEFGCFDLKTYTPMLRKIESKSFEYKVYELYGIKLGVKAVGRDRVKLYVIDVYGIDGNKQSGDWFELYVTWVKEINSLISYCNNLGLEVPEYKNN